MRFWGRFWLVVGPMIARCGVPWLDARGRRKLIAARISEGPGFRASHFSIDRNGQSGIAIDEARRKVVLYQASLSHPAIMVLEYPDLLEAEIIEDGASVTRSSRANPVARELLGIRLAGVSDPVAGSSGAPKKQEQKVSRIDFKVVVNDTERPVHIVSMLNVETDRGSVLHSAASKRATDWLMRIKAAMHIADEAGGV